MGKILHHSISLPCDKHRAFEMFTVDHLLQSWLCVLAAVEPRAGGKYELFWDPDDRENNSTVGCRVTGVEPDSFIAFEWKGPREYGHFMNSCDPLTHVVVFFADCGDRSSPCSRVHVIHSGWRSSGEWEEARLFFERAWDQALKTLKTVIAGA